MKKLAGVLLVLLVSVVVSVAIAQPERRPDGPPRQCSAATLRGDYLYANDGFRVKGSDARARTPFAEAGRETYDGAGKAKGAFTVSENGVVRRGTYTATYVIKADCTGSVTIVDNYKSTSHYDLYTTPTGDEVVWIQTDGGTVFAGSNRRRPMPPMGMGPGAR
ncbi:MAG TPA: hypothetical protein VEK57_21250 [Thermoanaerobaculia bacterium]|nr:hypothetical protein [Thermoanaerobaculia bacterium]